MVVVVVVVGMIMVVVVVVAITMQSPAGTDVLCPSDHLEGL